MTKKRPTVTNMYHHGSVFFGSGGTHLDDPTVTIVEVLPLCPSRTNGNVGHKHRSQATQLGQNLSHIDAYNGEEKVHMR